MPPVNRLVLPAYLLSLIVCAALLAAFWYWLGKPADLPEVASATHKLQCVSYSPFDKDQSPLVKTFAIRPQRLDADLALLARYFSCVRTYSMTGMEELPKYARKHGLKLMIGAWVGADPIATREEIELLVAMANREADIVQSVIVGNEALLRKDISGARLAKLIAEVKSRVPQPVTYADVWEFWLKHPQVAPAVDFITIHLLPYWEDDPTGIDRALDHVAAVREEYGRRFAPKDILIGETGWPSEGRQRETALPGRVNQARFIRGFVQRAEHNGWDYNLIEAFDQPWKRLHEGAMGGYWGLFDADRNDKNILAGPVSNLPDWRDWLAVSAGFAVVALGVFGLPRRTRDGAAMPVLAGLVGACMALWLHQAVLGNRDIWEWLWTVALVAVNALALLHVRLAMRGAAAASAVSARLRRAGGMGLMLAGFAGAALMAQLVFDARYRQFPSYVMLLPALVYLRWPVRVPRRETLLLLAVVAIGVPLQLLEEGLANAQALGWAAASALLAAALWRSSRTSRSPAMSAANTDSVTV